MYFSFYNDDDNDQMIMIKDILVLFFNIGYFIEVQNSRFASFSTPNSASVIAKFAPDPFSTPFSKNMCQTSCPFVFFLWLIGEALELCVYK